MIAGRARRRTSARTSPRAGLVRAAVLLLAGLALGLAAVLVLRSPVAREASPVQAQPRAPARETLSAHEPLAPPDRRAVPAAAETTPQDAPGSADSASAVAPPTPPRTGPAAPERERTSVDGRLCDASGAGQVGVALRLRERETGTEHTTESGADGLFAFPGVGTGPAALTPGGGEEPFLPPIDVTAQAPRTLLEDIVLPSLGTLEILVQDASGGAVEGAAVECLGSERGAARATTDAEGRVRFPGLPAGEARAFARHPTLGRANLALAFDPGRAERFEIRLHSRPPR